MPLKILIVPDKFKGTLVAEAAAERIAAGWRKARPMDSFDLLPMSDGGDGFGLVMSRLLGAKVQKVATVNAAHRACAANWWWEPKTKTAIIESAAVIGLAMLPKGQFHPFALDTFGLGRIVGAAAAKGARRCLIGIGGSATNDGGFGVARALGWRFFNARGELIQAWTGLDRLQNVRAPKMRRWFRELSVAVDVQNPLLGTRGATRVYGPQKGLRVADFVRAERCLARLEHVIKLDLGLDLARVPGTGAAGGLGLGLAAFLGGQLQPGFALFARQSQLDKRLRAADLVITGEGSIDDSTLMGKGVGEIARRCRELNVPCFGLAGALKESSRINRTFSQVRALTQLTTKPQAKANAPVWLERLAEAAGRSWTS